MDLARGRGWGPCLAGCRARRVPAASLQGTVKVTILPSLRTSFIVIICTRKLRYKQGFNPGIHTFQSEITMGS